MLKWLLVLAVLGLAWAAWRNGRQAQDRGDARPTAPRQPPAPQEMVACAHCGIHLPRGDALLLGGKTYCCAEHGRAGGPPP